MDRTRIRPGRSVADHEVEPSRAACRSGRSTDPEAGMAPPSGRPPPVGRSTDPEASEVQACRDAPASALDAGPEDVAGCDDLGSRTDRRTAAGPHLPAGDPHLPAADVRRSASLLPPEDVLPPKEVLPRDEIRAVVRAATNDASRAQLTRIDYRDQHSNDVFELRFDDGRTLVLKRARHEWARQRFRTARRASALLGSGAGIAVPEPLPLGRRSGPASPEGDPDRPRQAYWRIPHPTLDRVWRRLDEAGRRAAFRSWGALLARVHAVETDGWGALDAQDPATDALRRHLRRDIGERLLPACHALWADATGPLQRLLALIPVALAAAKGRAPSLAHNDMHMGNVLCRLDDDGTVACVGLLDLDDAAALPPESDAASLEALHGPLFEQHVSPRYRAEIWRGYGRSLDPDALTFFRALHLANLGFHSALVEDAWHAALVARALQAEVSRLERRTGTL